MLPRAGRHIPWETPPKIIIIPCTIFLLIIVCFLLTLALVFLSTFLFFRLALYLNFTLEEAIMGGDLVSVEPDIIDDCFRNDLCVWMYAKEGGIIPFKEAMKGLDENLSM